MNALDVQPRQRDGTGKLEILDCGVRDVEWAKGDQRGYPGTVRYRWSFYPFNINLIDAFQAVPRIIVSNMASIYKR